LKNIIKSSLLGLSIVLILVITINTFNENSQSFLNNNSFKVYAQMFAPSSGGGFPGGGQQQQTQEPGEYTSGTIASIQNGANGQPEWLLSGGWSSAVIKVDKEKLATFNQIPSNVITDKDNSMIAAMFQANFDMVMLNGSSLHTHNINNFTLSQISSENDKNHVVNGTATISMKDGPVNEVPVSIKMLDNNVISIWMDPAKINNHFGNTPIYGQILQDIVIKK
jgi:hypothetical protein